MTRYQQSRKTPTISARNDELHREKRTTSKGKFGVPSSISVLCQKTLISGKSIKGKTLTASVIKNQQIVGNYPRQTKGQGKKKISTQARPLQEKKIRLEDGKENRNTESKTLKRKHSDQKEKNNLLRAEYKRNNKKSRIPVRCRPITKRPSQSRIPLETQTRNSKKSKIPVRCTIKWSEKAGRTRRPENRILEESGCWDQDYPRPLYGKYIYDEMVEKYSPTNLEKVLDEVIPFDIPWMKINLPYQRMLNAEKKTEGEFDWDLLTEQFRDDYLPGCDPTKKLFGPLVRKTSAN